MKGVPKPRKAKAPKAPMDLAKVGRLESEVRTAPTKGVEERILEAELLLGAANEQLTTLREANRVLAEENEALRAEAEELRARYESEHFKEQLARMEEAEEQLRKNLEADRTTKQRGSWLRGRKR